MLTSNMLSELVFMFDGRTNFMQCRHEPTDSEHNTTRCDAKLSLVSPGGQVHGTSGRKLNATYNSVTHHACAFHSH